MKVISLVTRQELEKYGLVDLIIKKSKIKIRERQSYAEVFTDDYKNC